MKKFIYLLPILFIVSCTTETTYSSQMYGNNPDTITTGKKNNQINSSPGSSLLKEGATTKK